MSENKKKVAVHALASRVLVVAVEGGIKDWAAYIDAVKGYNHEQEWQEVKRHGTKISRRMAEMLFPEFVEAGLVWRD